MKTRIVGFVAALLVLFSVMGTAVPQASAAGGCGNYYVYKTGTPYCSGKCSIFSSKQKNLQKLYYKRKCVKGNNQTYWEYKTETKKLGCC